MNLCAVSIDLDPIDCYYQIHGLGQAPDDLRNVILTRALPRFRKIFEQFGIKSTLFVVGRDLDGDDNPKAKSAQGRLKEWAASGHEIGNHSYSHDYRFAARHRDVIAQDIRRAHELIGELGAAPVGFRAPGYDISANITQALTDQGYTYDSSILPAPLYYCAKLLAIGIAALKGSPSQATITDPRAIFAPTQPYQLHATRPWKRGHEPIIEFPIGVTPLTRIPSIGTTVALAPVRLSTKFVDNAKHKRFFNFELHGIDLIDAELDGIPGQLVQKQPDLQVSLATKQARLGNALERIAQTHHFTTLAEAAGQLFPDIAPSPRERTAKHGN